MIAAPPPGGCTVPVSSCTTIVVDTARAAVSHSRSPVGVVALAPKTRSISLKESTPQSPPSVFPPITFFGIATGALMALKTITAIAPKEPISIAKCSLGSVKKECRSPSVAMPVKEPTKLQAMCDGPTSGGLDSPLPSIFSQ